MDFRFVVAVSIGTTSVAGMSRETGIPESTIHVWMKRYREHREQSFVGSGKSSIIKLMCGQQIPHTGRVEIGNRLTISYVPQDAPFLSGGLRDYAKAQDLDETLFMTILSKLDFSKTQSEKDMRELSTGQKKKVLLAASLATNAHVYIWDEPLKYIDVLSRIQIEELILTYQPTMIFVEYDQAFCEKIATETVRLKV